MTTPRFFKGTLAIALLAALTAVGCSSGTSQGEAGHAGGAVASSSAGLPDGHIGAGEKLATAKREATGQSCVDCHGPEGNAPIDESYPKIGGQYHDYLAYSLQSYRDGRREHALMSSQAKGLTDQEIAHLAAYFGSRETQLRDLSHQ